MPNQKFTLTFDANLEVSKMKTALGDIQKSLNGLQLPQNITKGLQGTFQKLSDEVRNFEVQASKDINGKADFSKLEKSADRINSLFEKLKIQLKDLGNLSNKDLAKLLPDNVSKNINDANNALKAYNTTLKNIQGTIDSTTNKITEQQNKLQSYQNAINQLASQKSTKIYDSLKQSVQESDGTTRFETETEALNRLNEAYLKAQEALSKYQAKVGNNPTTGQQSYITRLTNQVNNLKAAYDSLNQEINNNTKVDTSVKALETSAKTAQTQITKLQADLQRLLQGRQGAEAQALQTLLNTLKQIQSIDFSKFSQDAQGTGEAIKQYLNENLQKLINNLQITEGAIKGQGPTFTNFRDEVQKAGAELVNFDSRMSEINQLKSRIQYFFGLNNAIQLVKRTMREAYNTIKELDKAMTETAVVTDFSVGDMWAQLPEYTKRANELGVTTKAAYEAATLYYQQGLKTNEVMAMSNETLKMARIAGLDAAVATDRMTNAIRGFNMEINTTNAQRIDDVYSKLAAISASNVDEISTAMTKVASLAHNANMEFETTAAFLAQIIETTRESAETAGTALKTVVARFSEVKKLVSEGELSGADEEGELIDVNKVSSALRTAGIDLNKYFLGEVGLDDIFMELASKWNSLTKLQQRYIATQAAGSRQQSRFIALMSDYARTQELVGEAYNANGAAAKQFTKTQESLESKLARLKNAWNEFAMGILNSDLVKIGVDVLTNLLNGINALTSGFGLLDKGASNFLNTFNKLVLLITTLRVGKGLTTGLFGSMLNTVTGGKIGSNFSEIAAGAMGVTPGKNLLGTLAAGAVSPFGGLAKGIGTAGKYGWGLAKGIGGAIRVGTGAKGALGFASGMQLAGGAGTAAGLVGLGATLTGITAAAGVAYVAIKKLYNESATGQIKIAEKYADSLQRVADAARSSQQEIESIQEEYKRLDISVQQATTTEERVQAIKSRSEYVKSLLEQNEVYAQYIERSEIKNGELYLTLDSEALAKACEEIANTALKVQSGKDIADANFAYQQYQKAQNEVNDLEQELKSAKEDRDNPYSYDQTEEGRKKWREDWDIDGLERDLALAQDRMIAFQKEYQQYAIQGAIGYIPEDYSDVEKTFLSNALGQTFNGDKVSQIIEDETTFFFGLLSEGVYKSTKDIYQEYIDTFKTKPPKDIEDDEDEMLNAIALEKARQDLEKENEDFVNAFHELPDELKTAFSDLITTGGQNIDHNTSEQLFNLFNNIPDELAPFWELLSEELQNQLIASSFNLNQDEIARQVLSKTFNYPSNIFSELFDKYISQNIKDFNLSNKQTEVLSNLFTDVAIKNKDSLDDFNTFITKLLKGVPAGKKNDVLELLNAIDVNDANNIKTTFDSLENLGVDFRYVGGNAENAADQLIELTNAIDSFNIEKFKEKLIDDLAIARDVEKRKDYERSFDEEQYNAIIAAGGNRDDFWYTGIKGAEYTFIGDDLDSIISILQQQLELDLRQEAEALQEQIAIGETLQGSKDTIGGENLLEAMAIASLNNEISDDQLDLFKQSKTLQSLIPLLSQLTANGLITEINRLLEAEGSTQSNKELLDLLNRTGLQPMAIDNPEAYKGDQTPSRARGISALEYGGVKAKFAVDEEATHVYDQILESLNQINIANQEWNANDEQRIHYARELSLAWSEQAKKLADLQKVIDENDDIITASKRDSMAYVSAIHEVGEAMREAYGEYVNDDFVKAHMKEITLARESKEAYQQLLDLLQQEFFENATSSTDEFGTQLSAIKDQMVDLGLTAESLNGLEFEGVAVLDGTPWLEVVQALLNAGYDVQAFFDSLGWHAELDTSEINGIIVPSNVRLVRNNPGGYGGYTPYKGSGYGRGNKDKGGGGGSKEPKREEWKSDFDWLYNLMEDITELERTQTKLQEEQNKILEVGNKSDTGRDLYENLVKQLANLQFQRQYQSTVQNYRRREMDEFMGVNSAYSRYFRFNDRDQTLEIDWDAINNIGDKETYEEVKNLVSEAEKIQDKMDDAEDSLRDVEKQIRELENIWRDEYADFEQRVLDALVSSYQRVIDNYSDLHDTITSTNDEILNALQQEINLERQIRDNTETEDAISDTEARLAYMRRDTTGGNQVGILNAQKQLDDSRQAYEDTLVNQAVERLQQDNQDAATQREKQIELMQAQLDYSVKNGDFNDDVSQLLHDALGANGQLLTDSNLFELLQQEESWEAMSDVDKEIWEDELNNTFKEVSAFLLKEKSEADGSFAEAIQMQIQQSGWEVGEEIGTGLSNMSWAIGSMSQAMQHVTETYSAANEALADANSALSNANAQLSGLKGENDALRGAIVNIQNGYEEALSKQQWQTIPVGGGSINVQYGQATLAEKKKKKYAFATGGLNTSTGPAWLDGTPSKPEYVLNALQTQAFLKLADVLPSIFNGVDTGSTNSLNSNMYLDFTINVDSIQNDYDVDRLVERVKSDIYDAATFRNINVVNFLR